MVTLRRRTPKFRDAISGYERRARVLRQIQSNKAQKAQRWELGYLVVTVLLATGLSVLGFAGSDRLATLFAPNDDGPVPRTLVEITLSIAALAILIVTLVGLIFRFGERANRHYRSLEVLTEFMRDCSDLVLEHDARTRRLAAHELALVRTRYKGLLATLPPSTDREHKKAKKDDATKRGGLARDVRQRHSDHARTRPTVLEPPKQRSPQEVENAKHVAHILYSDPLRRAILETVRDTLGPRAWVAGGFIREGVWDYVEGLETRPPQDDVDVVYFDRSNVSREAEREMERLLSRQMAGTRWSVKNQARMHIADNANPYTSLEDAVGRYPETASAVAVRLGRGRMHILAPLGLNDLRRMHHRLNANANHDAFVKRFDQVRGDGRWSAVEFLE